MFKRSFNSKDRVSKTIKPSRRSFRDRAPQTLLNSLDRPAAEKQKLSSSVVTLVLGREQRLFAAHEDILLISPYFQTAIKGCFFDGNAKRINLTDVQPEAFSCVLEYLYKGDYSPRLLHDKWRRQWYLEGAEGDAGYNKQAGGRGCTVEATMYHSDVGDYILRDTVLYCTADLFGLEELKRLALRKQGLQSGIDVATILRSARYAYENTPDQDSRLRAHYLALVIRSRKIFKRSGTMQTEMEMGGKLFFDLFVAMCNHMDDLQEQSTKGTPRTV